MFGLYPWFREERYAPFPCSTFRPTMSSARHFVYRYNGLAESDEVEFDRDGETPIPKQGGVIIRKGSSWKVVTVQVEAMEIGSSSVPIFRVFLQPA